MVKMLYIYLIISVLFLVNIAVSVNLSKRDDLEGIQKVMQIVFIWVIPFLGAFISWQVNRNYDVLAESRKEFGGGDNNAGYDTAGDGGGGDGGGSD